MFSEKPGLRIYAVDPSHKPAEGLNSLGEYGVLIVFETGYARKDFRTAIYKTISSNNLIMWNSYNANSGGGKWEVIK